MMELVHLRGAIYGHLCIFAAMVALRLCHHQLVSVQSPSVFNDIDVIIEE